MKLLFKQRCKVKEAQPWKATEVEAAEKPVKNL
jgi:hypothetical protein